MKLPIAWLRDYLDLTLSSDDIAARFAQLGFPVDAIERREHLSGVLIGRITNVEKHPDADRLQICTVDVLGPRNLTIATAATNVSAGDVVPVATIGARLVGLTIAPRKMRGIDSEGMLCSAAEVGLESAWFEDGIMHLDDTLTIGSDFVETFRLNDDVLDVEVTANRVDAMSVVGLARELAASLGIAVREPRIEIEHYHTVDTPDAGVSIESADCKRFVAQRFSNVGLRTAPFWMRVRLALAGQRPIDNLVDISNFVMLETAQPLHFYDFDRLAGGRLIARDARAGETIRTLDGTTRPLDERFLVIADEREPQSVAGLIGAAASEVSASTRELLVEAATFSGPRIRRMSVALGLRTEASARHEKGVPVGLAAWGAARAAHLLQLEGATVHAPFEATVSQEIAPPQAIRIALDRFRALLGIDIDEREAAAALNHLGFHTEASEDDSQIGDAPRRCLDVTAPPWRGDVRIAEDVVEEVARIIGYDRIVAEMPPVMEQSVSSSAYRTESRVAHELAALGYREAVTLALQPGATREAYARAGVPLPGDVVEVQNPLSEDQRFLRFSLIPALLALAERHARDEPYRIFEIGHTFVGEPSAALETAGVAWLAAFPATEEPAWRDTDFLRFKGESSAFVRALTGRTPEAVRAAAAGWHPGKTAALCAEGTEIATIGAIDPRLGAAFGITGRVYAGWMPFAVLPPYRGPRYVAPSKYPSVARDLALVVAPETTATEIERAVRAGGNGVLAEVRVFDEYRGPQVGDGKKSVAVRVVLQRFDATLTDADADAHIAAILAALRDGIGAKIRARDA
jgi:phenylalanyl-tRNA synthetase beta chain